MIAKIINQKKTSLACLIIDDPLLRPRYGCIDYKKLLQSMKEHHFFTEIAFIPWNYKRSDPAVTQIFKDNSDHYGICIHGCDHTGNEFGALDYKKLSDISALALWRMEQHKAITGLHYDPVMVFPQGHFSKVAIKALKDQGFVAAFNSTINAIDGNQPLPMAEYSYPATYFYHDFPLFLRRYPKDKELFIQDINLNRPIIIVEHHTAFRNGHEHINKLVDWINSVADIKWCSLMDIATHYMVKKPIIPRSTVNHYKARVTLNYKVALRRYLSEIRDNYIHKSNFLSNLYHMIRNS